MSARDSRLVALDWGTTWLRAHRLAAGGVAIESRQLPLGIARLARAGGAGDASEREAFERDTFERDAFERDAFERDAFERDAFERDAFERAFDQACGDWVRESPGTPIIACGMVGSAQGWREVPYLALPASAETIAPALLPLSSSGGAVVHIVPGLIQRCPAVDVMRGEETQIVGALDQEAAGAAGGERALIILPGTHSKWAQVRGRAIVHFDTFMTGEIYQALASHTMLAHTLRRGALAQEAGWDLAAFDRGVQLARSDQGRAGALATVFSTRALAVTGELPGDAQADYLSGLLIGHELRGARELDASAFDSASRVLLVGSDPLCRRYRRALAAFGLEDVELVDGAAERGLWCLARAAGLVAGDPDRDLGDRELVGRDLVGGGHVGGDLVGRRPVDRDRVHRDPNSPAAAHGSAARGSAAHRAGALCRALDACGLLAILRGVQSSEAAAIGAALHAAGFRAIEVPLNSPAPLESIRVLRDTLSDCAIGAGTVLRAAEIDGIRRAGADFIVMPHADPDVIRAAAAAGLDAAPGVATLTEAFHSLAAGAALLKLFPADEIGPAALAAWRSVLPAGTGLIAVGGITPDSLGDFAAAGATGFGLGSALYRPGFTAQQVGSRAADFASAWRAATRRPTGA